MNLDSITLHQLRIFCKICELGSFTHAAEALNIAQPALSRQIKNLEQRLGLTLLDRTSRPLKPTQDGGLIRHHAQDVLNAAQRLLSAAALHQDNMKRVLAIGFVGSALIGDLPKALKKLHATEQNIQISMVEKPSIEQISALKKGQIHIGFGRIIFDEPGIQQIILKHEPLYVAASAEREDSCDADADLAARLAQETLILYPKSNLPGYADQVRSALHAQGILPRDLSVVADLHTALGLAAANLGVTIVPQPVARMARPDLQFSDLSSLELTSPITANVPAQDLSPDARLLLEFIQAAMSETQERGT